MKAAGDNITLGTEEKRKDVLGKGRKEWKNLNENTSVWIDWEVKSKNTRAGKLYPYGGMGSGSKNRPKLKEPERQSSEIQS